jgi:hypothetical protein
MRTGGNYDAAINGTRPLPAGARPAVALRPEVEGRFLQLACVPYSGGCPQNMSKIAQNFEP